MPESMPAPVARRARAGNACKRGRHRILHRQDAAVEAAILTAGKAADGQVEVVSRDADLRVETVWRSGQGDASGR